MLILADEIMGNLVVKDNALIEASHKLGEVEQRLVLLAILKAREVGNSVEQLKDKELIIHADNYANTFGINRQMAYKALKQAVMGLYRAEWGYKYINEKGNKVFVYERFTQSAKYIEGEGVVSFTFASAIIPFLVELEKRFTVYEIEQVAQLSSGYAMRLYEFFMQYFDKQVGKGWLEISLDDLRFRFGLLPTEYINMSDFKKRVLDKSIKEINMKTDLTATYEQKKRGRVIVGFRFDFTRKQQQQPEKIQDTPKTSAKPDLFADFSDAERKAIQARIDEYIKHQEQKGELISDFYRTNITKKAIAERWGLDILVKQQEKAKIAKAEREQKKAEEQAEKLKKENERKDIEKQRNFVIREFERLQPEQQETVIQAIFEQVGQGAFKQIFQTAQKQGTVHTDARFVKKFYEYFKQEERAKRAKKLTDLPVRHTEEEIKQENLRQPVQGTISFSDDWKKHVEKQLIMYRDFKNMMNEDAIREIELIMRMFNLTSDDLEKF